jgi:hypothetical protein
MSFFKKEEPAPTRREVQPVVWKVNRPAEKGSRGVRGLGIVALVKEDKRGRGSMPVGGKGLDRSPQGVLFKMKTGWIDELGFWCEWNGKPGAESCVYRNPPRKMRALMTSEQARLLARARERGVKKGVR